MESQLQWLAVQHHPNTHMHACIHTSFRTLAGEELHSAWLAGRGTLWSPTQEKEVSSWCQGRGSLHLLFWLPAKPRSFQGLHMALFGERQTILPRPLSPKAFQGLQGHCVGQGVTPPVALPSVKGLAQSACTYPPDVGISSCNLDACLMLPISDIFALFSNGHFAPRSGIFEGTK